MDQHTHNRTGPEHAADRLGTAPGPNRSPEGERDLLAKAVAAAVLVGGLNAMVQLVRLAFGH